MDEFNNWDDFLIEFETYILPIYKHHEKSFDDVGIHGRLHISRALIFAEWMARYYSKYFRNDFVDYFAIRIAIAFHDSGRQGNGIDIWERDSAKLCFNYLLQRHSEIKNTEYPIYISKMIEKSGEWDLNKQIVHDADVLEIMRPCCGHGGIDGFISKRFYFLESNFKLNLEDQSLDNNFIRENIIKEAWNLILVTEENKEPINEQDNYIRILSNIIKANPNTYPLLYELF